MSSQLNPNAAEFVPVSPTRLLMMDDAIISASPRLGFEKSMDDVQVPSEKEFLNEISHRAGDLGVANGPKPKHGDDYFMRDNFSTLRNKSPDFNSTSSCTQLEDDSAGIPTACAAEDVPFDKLEAVQNISEDKENVFGLDSDFCRNAFGGTNVFAKNYPMAASLIEDGEFTLSLELEDGAIPGTPKSTIVEAPASPTNGEVSPLNHQTDLDSPTDDCLVNPPKLSDLMSSEDGPEDTLALGQERTSSENGVEEGENNITEGFRTEHRKSPPINLSFKPIQMFSDTNPFGALQTPSSTTPLDHIEINAQISADQNKILIETPQKSSEDHLSFIASTPSSFISVRQKTPLESIPVPFDELESPTDIPHFELPPNANSSLLASELPKSPEPQLNSFEESIFSKKVLLDSEVEIHKPNDVSQNIFLEENSPKYEETSFTTEIDSHKETIISHEDLDTTAGFLIEESKILNYDKDDEQSNLIEEKLVGSFEISQGPDSDSAHINNSLGEIKPELIVHDDCNVPVADIEPLTEIKDSDFESETKEMHLEFESHIPSQTAISDDLGNFDEGFEVISKEELTMDENTSSNEHVEKVVAELQLGDFNETPASQQNENLSSPIKQMNPFVMNEHLPTSETSTKADENKESLAVCGISVNSDYMKVSENVSPAEVENLESSENSQIPASPLEPQVTKTESYLLLTPADEPICTKTESFLTEAVKPLVDEEINSENVIQDIPVVEVEQALKVAPDQAESLGLKTEENTNLETVQIAAVLNELSLAKEEPVLFKPEPVHSQVVTETLITALEETSEVPSLATTEVPSTAGTPPPTPVPAPEVGSKDDSEKTDMLVAAVAAAGAVAAGATLAVDKVRKEAAVAPKKPSASISKKPGDATTKAPTKAAPAKAPAAKPATAKTSTTKPASAATKPAGSSTKPAGPPAKPTATTTGPKLAASKPTSAPIAAKKPLASAKPAAPKAAAASSLKPAATSPAPKAVPKQLSVNKTATTFKPTSKPTTPTSKPTTPTAPKSPSVVKTDVVKSPPRPAVRSTLTTSKPLTAAKSPAEESAEKKSVTNGIKKLADGPAKKPATTSTTKPLVTARPSAPVPKTAPATKAPTTVGAKPLASKQVSAVPPKTKPTTTTTAIKPTMPPAIKRPTSGTAVNKPTDKTGKETVNKQISNTKPAVNGKTVPAKTAIGAKKTDAKVNGKTTDKLVPSKTVDGIKAENDMPAKVQEDNVTTTNGYGAHNDHAVEENGSMKIQELSPVILENVN